MPIVRFAIELMSVADRPKLCPSQIVLFAIELVSIARSSDLHCPSACPFVRTFSVRSFGRPFVRQFVRLFVGPSVRPFVSTVRFPSVRSVVR